MRTVFVNHQPIIIDSAQLIQSGGEGMVFAVGETAVKLYHQPQPQHAPKLRHLLTLPLPVGILAPCALVEDRDGQVIGFQMPRLDHNAQMLKQLGNPIYWQKNNLQIANMVALFQHIYITLRQLHTQHIIVGDLNDCNLFFVSHAPPSTFNTQHSAFWIDADSYQFATFPCPVAQQPFLDPLLYAVSDFSQRPYFTELTDWYAYTVLLVKSLLQVHPYGGSHHHYKSLQARATAGISILDKNVTYPQNGRPPDTLSDDLLHYLHRVFDKGERFPFPAQLLAQYAAELTICSYCGLSYPRSRRYCPGCQHRAAIPQMPVVGGLRSLLEVDGFIEYVGLLANGRLLTVLRSGEGYKLVRLGIGGTLDEMALFNGRFGYRFGSFGNYLVVHPGNGRQLLILDTSGIQPQKITMTETATFRDSAVFATTPHALYRIAGNWIMRGQVREGLYIEDPVATAHRAQTQFFASPYTDVIAGYHRVFAEQRFFLLNGKGSSYDLPISAPQPGESVAETAVVFGPDSVAIYRLVGQNGRFQTYLHVYDLQGKVRQQLVETADAFLPQHYPYTTTTGIPFLQPINTAVTLDETTALLTHSQGVLLQQTSQLQLMTS